MTVDRPSLRIGGVPVANPLWLAPLAGITISPVRRFFLHLGAGLVHTEMISCAGLTRGNRKTKNMLDLHSAEEPVVLQLFAGDAKDLLEGAEIALEKGHFAAIGINMACPMPKVLKKGAGARLLEKPLLISEMIRQLKKLGYPVWVKIRKTGEKHPLDTLDLCHEMISAGVDNISIHGRTPAQRYEGRSDKQVIFKAASKFKGMISASGDIFSPEDAIEFLDSGCVAVLFARGAMRDPFIIPRTLAMMGEEVDPELVHPSIELQVELLKTMGQAIVSDYNDKIAEILVKRFLAGMFRGTPGISELRRNFAMIHGWDNLCRLLDRSKDILERRDRYEWDQ